MSLHDSEVEAITPSTASAHAFVDDVGVPELADDDRWHLTRVLRLRAGAPVTVADGAGSWRPCRLGAAGTLEPLAEVTTDERPPHDVTVAFSLVKGDRPDLVVQKLTELGVDRIVPFAADRSVVRWDAAKAARHMRRFGEIVRHAGMQSRRARLPAIGLPGAGPGEDGAGAAGPARLPAFAPVAALPGASLADPSGRPPDATTSTVLVGPEGGWAERERGAGLPRVRLGGHVMRAETAAITAGALLVALRSDIVTWSVPTQVVGSGDP